MAAQRGSGFVGLDKYLAANRKKAGEMADALGNPVDTAGREAQRDVEDVTEQYKRDVWAGMPQYNENGAPLTAADALERSKATYKGPGSLSDMPGWDAARQKADKAAEDSARLASFSGRMGALQDQYGKQGGYTLGQQRLDSFLSGAAGSKRFEDLKARYGALSQGLGGLNTASQGQAQTAAQSVKDDASRYGGMVPGLQTQEAEAAAQQRKAEQERRRREDAANRREQIGANRERKSKPLRQWDTTAP